MATKMKVKIEKKSECVWVVIRCRPMATKEVNEGRQKAV